MVVIGPWPGYTLASSPNGNRTPRIELKSVAWSPPGKSVRPMDPANNVSPTNRSFPTVACSPDLETHSPWTVPGRVMHPHLVVAEGQTLTWCVELINRRGAGSTFSPNMAAVLHGSFVKEQIVAVQVDGDTEGTLRSRDARHVIDVGMRQEDVPYGQTLATHERQQTLDFVARIDQHRFPGTVAADNEAVLEEWSHRLCLNYHGANPHDSRPR